jgi:Arc/MetJ-type ribon-helix-helix transcriptional regulator
MAYRGRMAETTTIRVSRDTHARVTRLAAERHESIDETVRSALRALRQDAMGRDLAEELTEDETTWLDADAG